MTLPNRFEVVDAAGTVVGEGEVSSDGMVSFQYGAQREHSTLMDEPDFEAQAALFGIGTHLTLQARSG